MAVLGKLSKIISNVLDMVTFNRFQDSVISVLNPLLTNPTLGGHLVKAVNLDNTKDNFVNTGLGANYQGWFVTRIYNARGFTDVFESSTVNNSPDKYIILNCFDKVSIDLWVF